MDPSVEASYIRLAGSFQSWAKPKLAGNISYTELEPTQTALIGLVAAAFGLPRKVLTQSDHWIHDLEFAIRQDRVGRTVRDFQTINPPTESEAEFRRRIRLMVDRKNPRGAMSYIPNPGKGSAIVERTHLTDSEFVVRVSHPELGAELGERLSSTVFSCYLGRRAFPPAFPFYLGAGAADMITTIPVCQTREPASSAWDWYSASGESAETLGSKTPVRISYLKRNSVKTEFVEVPVVVGRNNWLQAVGDLAGLSRP